MRRARRWLGTRLLLDPGSGDFDRDVAVRLQAGDGAGADGAFAVAGARRRLRFAFGRALHRPFRLDALAYQIGFYSRHPAFAERLVVAVRAEAIRIADRGN